MNSKKVCHPIMAPVGLPLDLPPLEGKLMNLIFKDVCRVFGFRRADEEQIALDERSARVVDLLRLMQHYNLEFRGDMIASLVHLLYEHIADDAPSLLVSAKLAVLLAIQDLYRMSDEEIIRVGGPFLRS